GVDKSQANQGVQTDRRRGTSEGHAECDFECETGVFRARWSVRRARGRVDGNLMQPKVSLLRLEDGVALGRNATEVRAAIEERLGLNFEQFRRSALLAQGDFAAFLKATPKERGALLERMTDTPIYAALSKAAHERAKEEAHALARDEAVLEARSALPHAERERLSAELEACRRSLTTLDASHAEAQAQQSILRRNEELDAAVEAASQEERQLRARAKANADDELRLQQLRAIAGLDGRFRTFDQAEADARARANALKDARAARNEARAAMAKVERDLSAQQDARRAFDSRAATFERTLERAAEVDAALAAREPRVAELGEAITAGRADVEALGARRSAQQQAAEALHTANADDDAWASLRPYRQEAQGAERAVEALRTESAAMRALERAEQELGSEEEALGTARDRMALHALELESLEAAAEEAAARLQTADETLRARRTAEAALRWLDAKEMQDAVQTRTNAARDLTVRCRASLERAEARARTLAKELEFAERERGSRDAAYRAASRLQSAARLRSELREGEPCPVCGSTDHEGAPDNAVDVEVDDGVVDAAAAEAALEEAIAQVEGTTRLVSAARDVRSMASEMLRRVERLLAGHERVLADLQRQYQSRAAELDAQKGALAGRALRSPEAMSPSELIDFLSAHAPPDRDGIAARSERLERAVHSKREALREAQMQHVDVRHAWSRQLESTRRLRDAWNTARGVMRRWLGEGALRVADLKADGLEYERRHRARLERAERLSAHGAELAATDERLRALRETLKAQEAEHAYATTAMVELQKERQTLVEGMPLARARARRAEEEARLRQTERAIGEHRITAARAASSADALVETRLEEKARADSSAEIAQEALGAALAEHGLDLPRARALRADQTDFDALAERIDALRRELTRASARVEQRRMDRKRHQAKHAKVFGLADAPAQRSLFDAPSEESEAVPVAERLKEVSARLATLSAERERLKTLADVSAARLADDEAFRTTHADERKALETRRAQLQTWQDLAELIGSADGGKFRTFAQSLTLDILLGRANAQLERLLPRYRLERADGSDLGLQAIDLDLGGAVRSIDTLSGGETFVVSLALALALAGLSAQRTPLRTLFIDEGFGSLDADSLEDVLDVLDALQAEGKQIGVISHVGDIAERFPVRIELEKGPDGRSKLRVVPAPEASAHAAE
ncbi:MAG: SbcC/MukB-like Walker B domain-containing protein, partial [Myxococcota bacterium]